MAASSSPACYPPSLAQHRDRIGQDGLCDQPIRARGQTVAHAEIHVDDADLEVSNGKKLVLLLLE